MNCHQIILLLLIFCTMVHFSSCLCGGKTAKLGTVPYHVQVRFIGKYICSGAIVIAPDGYHVIITSGKCLTETQNDNLRPISYMNVYAGRTRINGTHIYEQIQPVVHSIRHPGWRRKPWLENDLGVLHLETGFKFNAIVQPVNVTNFYQKNPNCDLVISGWGEASPKATNLQTYLQVAGLKTVSNKVCTKQYGTSSWKLNIPKEFLCGGTPGNPSYQGPCDGDNGSPATCLINDYLFLVGVYSFRHPECGNRYQPALFVDLSYYLPFLREATRRPIGVRSGNTQGPGFVWEEPDPELLKPSSAVAIEESRISSDEPEETMSGRSFGGQRDIDSSEY